MILGASDHQRLEFILARDASEESPEIGLHLRLNQIAPLLGREHTMHEPGHVGVRHGFSVETIRLITCEKMSNGNFAFPSWERRIRRPYGTRSPSPYVPGVGNAGLLSVVPPGR